MVQVINNVYALVTELTLCLLILCRQSVMIQLMALCFPVEVIVGSTWGKVNLPKLMPRPAKDLDKIWQRLIIGKVQLYVY